jgi:DNA-binding response OmpR family regulator
MPHILVADDEPLIADSLSYSLTREGFQVSVARDGLEALSLATARRPDLAVLDVLLPALDGIEVCRRLRAVSTMPVIMLTARGEEMDRVAGLESGADDYLVKPFSFRELLARIRATLRRVALDQQPPSTGPVVVGDLVLDRGAHRVSKRGQELELSVREYALLDVLMDNAGRAVGRTTLLNSVWGPGWVGDPRTLDVHIRWLRLKVEDDPAAPGYIQTVRGFGYRFAAPEEFGEAA